MITSRVIGTGYYTVNIGLVLRVVIKIKDVTRLCTDVIPYWINIPDIIWINTS